MLVTRSTELPLLEIRHIHTQSIQFLNNGKYIDWANHVV